MTGLGQSEGRSAGRDGFPAGDRVPASRSNAQSGLPQPADDHRPVSAETMPVHRVSAEDRLAVMAAHHLDAPGARCRARRTALTLGART